MTAAPSVVTPNDVIALAARIMRDENVGCVPVVDDRDHMRLVGVITDRDITVRCTARWHGPGCLVRDHMTDEDLITVRLEASIDDVASLMGTHQVRRVPVLDRDGCVEGIVALADVAVRFGPWDPLVTEDTLERISSPANTRGEPAELNRLVGAGR
jgi:CBS domain-containing protein